MSKNKKPDKNTDSNSIDDSKGNNQPQQSSDPPNLFNTSETGATDSSEDPMATFVDEDNPFSGDTHDSVMDGWGTSGGANTSENPMTGFEDEDNPSSSQFPKPSISSVDPNTLFNNYDDSSATSSQTSETGNPADDSEVIEAIRTGGTPKKQFGDWENTQGTPQLPTDDNEIETVLESVESTENEPEIAGIAGTQAPNITSRNLTPEIPWYKKRKWLGALLLLLFVLCGISVGIFNNFNQPVSTTPTEVVVGQTTAPPVVEATTEPEPPTVEVTPPTELVETTEVPPTELVETTEAPPTELVETTEAPPTELVETTEAPTLTVVVETTEAPLPVVVETTEAPPTELVETTEAPPTELVETTEAPPTTDTQVTIDAQATTDTQATIDAQATTDAQATIDAQATADAQQTMTAVANIQATMTADANTQATIDAQAATEPAPIVTVTEPTTIITPTETQPPTVEIIQTLSPTIDTQATTDTQATIDARATTLLVELQLTIDAQATAGANTQATAVAQATAGANTQATAVAQQTVIAEANTQATAVAQQTMIAAQAEAQMTTQAEVQMTTQAEASGFIAISSTNQTLLEIANACIETAGTFGLTFSNFAFDQNIRIRDVEGNELNAKPDLRIYEENLPTMFIFFLLEHNWEGNEEGFKELYSDANNEIIEQTIDTLLEENSQFKEPFEIPIFCG